MVIAFAKKRGESFDSPAGVEQPVLLLNRGAGRGSRGSLGVADHASLVGEEAALTGRSARRGVAVHGVGGIDTAGLGHAAVGVQVAALGHGAGSRYHCINQAS